MAAVITTISAPIASCAAEADIPSPFNAEDNFDVPGTARAVFDVKDLITVGTLPKIERKPAIAVVAFVNSAGEAD